MAKKSRRTIQEQTWKLYRIHREFVRRNTEYREEYEDYQRMREAPELKQTIAMRELSAKWGIIPDDLPNPNEILSAYELFPDPTAEDMAYLMWEYPDDRHHQLIDAFYNTWQRRDVDPQKVAGTLFLLYFPEGKRNGASYTAFDMRWSKKDLMEVLEDYLDKCLIDRKKGGLKQEVPRERHRPDEWLSYLKAYDLRQQKFTHKYIDRILFPRAGGDEKRGSAYFKKGAALVAKPPLLPQRDKKVSKLDVVSKKRKGE